MPYIILLIIWLLILAWTYFSPLKNKWWILYIFLIYLGFLLYTWYDAWLESISFYSALFFLDWRDIGFIFVVFFEFFFICYLLLYFLIFILFNKKISNKFKIYLLFRDFFVLLIVYLFFFAYNDIVWKYGYYYDWYKNPEFFHDDVYICEDTNLKLIMDYRYNHNPIVNPYDNYFEFYLNFGNKDNPALVNKLNNELLIKDFLVTCKNKLWENYYDNYEKIHNSKISLKKEFSPKWLDYKYVLSNEEVKNILEKLDEKRNYKQNLIDYNYREKKLSLTKDDINNWNVFILDDAAKDDIKNYFTWSLDDKNEFKKLSRINDWWICWKYLEECPDWKLWLSQDFLKKVIYDWYAEFFQDDKENIYTTNMKWVYIWEKNIFTKSDMWDGTSWPIDKLWKIWDKISFEFLDLDLENNELYQKYGCKYTLYNYEKESRECYQSASKSKNFWSWYELCLEDVSRKYPEAEVCNNYKLWEKFEKVKKNIYFDWELFNQEFNLDSSNNIFSYNWKIGFIAEKNWKYFIIYDWKQVSEYFDYIKTSFCCASPIFPFNIYEDWLLQYIFKRGEDYFVAYIDLK